MPSVLVFLPWLRCAFEVGTGVGIGGEADHRDLPKGQGAGSSDVRAPSPESQFDEARLVDLRAWLCKWTTSPTPP
jgi:hypothetical protein